MRISDWSSDVCSSDLTVLKESVKLLPGEIIDASVMSKRALVEFLEAQIADAKAQDVLLSVHLKATMMKVYDPIIFGDRKSDVEGKSVSVRVDLGGRWFIKKKTIRILRELAKYI